MSRDFIEREKVWRWDASEHARTFVIEDLQSTPIDPTDPAGSWRAERGAQDERPVAEIRLAGSPTMIAAFTVTVEINAEWEIVETFLPDKGAWVASGEPTIRARDGGARQPPARVRRTTIDGYLPQVREALRDALRIDDSLHRQPEWRAIIAGEWRLAEPRSRRAASASSTPYDIQERLEQGDSLPRIAGELGPYHQQALANVRQRQKRRRLEEPGADEPS